MFENLVPKQLRNGYGKTCRYEVLIFVSEADWNLANEEKDMKKKIDAKFRSYLSAYTYAIEKSQYTYKVILRA